jgi:succinyl-diaminopimelate desuccinylase
VSETLELTRALIREVTVNPPGDEARCIGPLANRLQQAGFQCRSIDLAPGRPNLVARLDGADPSAPAIAFTGHLDTVPLGEADWTRDPFAADVEDDRVYGRGASDMKSGVAAIVVAACRYAAEGAKRPVEVVLTSSEEIGLQGARLLSETPGSLGPASALVVAEPTNNRPAFGNRGILWLDVRFDGKTAHASEPHLGVNALLLACAAAERLAAYDFGGAEHAALGRPTLNVAVMHAGANHNSVPDRATLGLDLRLLPDADITAVIGTISDLAGEQAGVSEVLRCPGLWTDPSDPWLQGAIETTAAITGTNAVMGTVPFNTDGAFLAPAYGEIPTLILGPGDPAQAHKTDEWCSIAKIDEATAIYLALMRRY